MKKIIIKMLLLFAIFISFGIQNIYAEETETVVETEEIKSSNDSGESNVSQTNKPEEVNNTQTETQMLEGTNNGGENTQPSTGDNTVDVTPELGTNGEEITPTNDNGGDLTTPTVGEQNNEIQEPTQTGNGTIQTNDNNIDTTILTSSEQNGEPTQTGATSDPIETPEPTEPTNVNNEEYLNQKIKVIILKLNNDNEPVSGAKLQLFDSEGNPISDPWVSDGSPKIFYLIAGKYVLKELEAPKGYIKSADVEFEVNVVIPDIEAGVDYLSEPCPHYGGTPMFYVTIAGEKYEVYCINQNWETPDENSEYNGSILTPDNLRNYTKQTVPIDAAGNNSTEKIDISDKSLNDEELYNKIVDIIYHRFKAASVLADRGLTYSEEEIRFITEVALRNYTNADLTEVALAYRKSTNTTFVPLDAPGVLYDERSNGNIFYLRHNYRDYVYTPDVPLGQDIVKIDFGKGDSFGQMIAGHFNSYSNAAGTHDAKHNQEERDQVARYYELFKYLIGEGDSHPDDMHIYIYSSNSISPTVSGNNHDDGQYQNLLGVTGYLEGIEEQEQEVIMYDDYSDEERSIPVVKIWEDKEDYLELRPKTVTVNLKADGKIIQTVTLSEEDGWDYLFEHLPVYNKGKEIIYTLNEVVVPEYDSIVEGDMYIGFTVINTHYGTGGNPPTADNIVVYLLLIVASLFGLIKFSYMYIKDN